MPVTKAAGMGDGLGVHGSADSGFGVIRIVECIMQEPCPVVQPQVVIGISDVDSYL